MDKLVNDVHDFHAKFGLDSLQPGSPQHIADGELVLMRANFMLEELFEYAQAVGLELTVTEESVEFTKAEPFGNEPVLRDLEKALDGLVDLAYVLAGTALLHGFGNKHELGKTIIGEAWQRVHNANMRKIRATSAEESKRKSGFDVVKPEGWQPPKLHDLVGGN